MNNNVALILRVMKQGAPLACVLTIGSVWAMTLFPGHDWTGDFAQYIHHAANLADGLHYADTGYIVSGSSTFVGPYTYPPVFPVLLAPVYWMFGLNLEALKSVAIISFSLALLVFPKVIGDELSHTRNLLVICLVGANPTFWSSSNNIHSDFTFMLFTYLSLWLMRRKLEEEPQTRGFRGAMSCILIGFAMYLSYGSREIGVILPLCIITYELVARRKITLVSLLSVSTFMLLAYSQHQYLQVDLTPMEIKEDLSAFTESLTYPATVSHLDFVDPDLRNILARARNYYWALHNFLPANNYFPGEIVISSVFWLSLLLAGVGYLVVLRRAIGVIEIFCAGYIATLLLFGAPAYERYVYPLFPFFLYYTFKGYDFAFSLAHWPKMKHLAGVLLLGLVAVSYLQWYVKYDSSILREGVTHPDAISAFDFIRESTESDATIVARNPRIVALFTDRSSIADIRGGHQSDERINEFYVASGSDYYLDYERNGVWIRPLTDSAAPTDSFTEIFRNTRFALYRFDSGSKLEANADTP